LVEGLGQGEVQAVRASLEEFEPRALDAPGQRLEAAPRKEGVVGPAQHQRRRLDAREPRARVVGEASAELTRQARWRESLDEGGVDEAAKERLLLGAGLLREEIGQPDADELLSTGVNAL